MFSSKQGLGNANESSTRAAKYLSVGIGNVTLPTISSPPVAHFNQTAMNFNGTNSAICIQQTSLSNSAASWSATSSNSQDGGTNGKLWIGSTGQFTLEYWIYFNNVTGQIGFFESGTNGIAFGVQTNHTTIYWSLSGVNYGTTWTVPALVTGTWYHMVFQRSQNGLASPQVGFWLNGTSYAGQTNSNNFTGTNPLSGKTTPFIGGGTGSVFINAYMQEFRISNIARYAPNVNFTVPNAPFVNDPNTLLLIHGTSPLADDNS